MSEESSQQASKPVPDGREQLPVWKIRPMRQEDIADCLNIWFQVELTEAYQTVSSTLASDPYGFYVAEVDGQVIGMCAGPMTRHDTAFMGFYAVEPRYQGKGVGRELWAKTIERLDESKNIGLYGVPAMSNKYKKSGFRIEDSIRMLIYESVYISDLDGHKKHEIYPENLSSLDDNNLNISSIHNNKWLLVSKNKTDFIDKSDLFDLLVRYDEDVNNFSRENLLTNYLQGDDVPLTVIILMPKDSGDPQSRVPSSSCYQEDTEIHKEQGILQGQNCCQTLTATGPAKLTKEEVEELSSELRCDLSIAPKMHQASGEKLHVVGYGCVRHDNTGGGMIGPLYADSDQYYEIILRQLIERFPLPSGGKFSAMSLTSNTSGGEILEKIGLRQMDQCSRMFTKFVPQASLSKVYLVHSPNFTLF